MANHYTDHPELRFELNHPMMERIVELKERGFRDKENFDYAPLDFEDAMDSYDRVLDIDNCLCGLAVVFTVNKKSVKLVHSLGNKI